MNIIILINLPLISLHCNIYLYKYRLYCDDEILLNDVIEEILKIINYVSVIKIEIVNSIIKSFIFSITIYFWVKMINNFINLEKS
jgi:hypothetical protein